MSRIVCPQTDVQKRMSSDVFVDMQLWFACPVLLFNLTHVIFKHLLKDFEDTLDTEDRNDLCYPPHCVKPSIAGRARPSHAVGLTKPTGDTAVPSVAGRARPSHAAHRVLQI